MRYVRRSALLACLLALPPAAAPAAQADDRAARVLVRAVNEARVAHGLAPVRASRSLTRQSKAWSRRIARRGRLRHASMSRACARHDFRRMGEVLAHERGARPRPAALVEAWMGSPDHRAVLLEPRMRWIGAARSFRRPGRTTWWVARLGRR